MHVGELLKLIDDLGLADNTIVQYSTDNGPHYNTWPDAGTTPFRGEKNSNWEGAFRVPCFIRWPGHFPADVTLNGIVSHEDWLPTFAAAAGHPTSRRNCSRAWNSTAAPTRTTSTATTCSTTSAARPTSRPAQEFIYVGDDGDVMAIRVGDWKATYLENRAHQLQVWREPFVHLRLPLLFNLRRDPFEKSHAELEHLPRLDDRPGLRARAAAGGRQQVPHEHEGISAQPDAGRLESRFAGEADQEHDAQPAAAE